MGEKTHIAWTDHTWNPWWGCTEISPGCDNCYARGIAARFAPGNWGVKAGRREFGYDHWREPLKWNARARLERRMRVFCASMADVFDNHPTAETTRPRLWELIRDTPFLDWQILTKRIGNAKAMLPADWGDGYPNVWLGASVVTQAEADRDIPKLLATPARIRFLSCEPLLEAIELSGFMYAQQCASCSATQWIPGNCLACHSRVSRRLLHWIIVGGESGSQARLFNGDWARDVLQQCRAAGVAFFMKQTGTDHALLYESVQKNRNGADPSEWPEDLRVQEFPT